ncbi:MAG: FAD-dependent oxidoreductase [Pseudomonadota bacterium]
MNVAIVGAGMAGAAAARALADAGCTVELFDKSRGAGGRMATRRRTDPAGRTLAFDHGAQWTVAHAPQFAAFLEGAIQSGHAARWPEGPQKDALVGTPGMNALAKAALGTLPLTTSFTLDEMHRVADGWWLLSKEGGEAGPFDAVILAMPAPQQVAVLAPHHQPFADAARSVRYDPSWALMLGFAPEVAGRLATLSHEALTERHISWLACDSGKPGRSGATLVAHADAHWSRDNLEREQDDVCRALTETVCGSFDLPPPQYMSAHRWRYSRVVEDAALSERFDAQTMLGVAGDWTAGPDIDAAYMSGLGAARQALAALGR